MVLPCPSRCNDLQNLIGDKGWFTDSSFCILLGASDAAFQLEGVWRFFLPFNCPFLLLSLLLEIRLTYSGRGLIFHQTRWEGRSARQGG